MAVYLDDVKDFMATNMFHKEKWVELTDEAKQIVSNYAESQLYRELPHHFRPGVKPIPMDVLCEQILWVLEFDDSHRRAEMGLSYFFTSGLYVSFDKDDMNRSIARTILHRYPRRRVGMAVVNKRDTFRGYSHTKLGDY